MSEQHNINFDEISKTVKEKMTKKLRNDKHFELLLKNIMNVSINCTIEVLKEYHKQTTV